MDNFAYFTTRVSGIVSWPISLQRLTITTVNKSLALFRFSNTPYQMFSCYRRLKSDLLIFRKVLWYRQYARLFGRACKYLRRLHGATRDQMKQIYQDTALRWSIAYRIKPGSPCSLQLGESVLNYILFQRK